MLPCIETREGWLLGVPQNFKYNAMRTLVRLDPLLSVQAISTRSLQQKFTYHSLYQTSQTRGIGLSALT